MRISFDLSDADLKHFRAGVLGDAQTEATDAELLRQAFGADLRCVWARREDKLRQAISMWKAKQTNIYNSIQTSAAERPEPAAPPEYDHAEIKKIVEPDFTVSFAIGSPKVSVVSEDEIPGAYWKEQAPKLDRLALGAALKSGEAIPGARLTNGSPFISVRTK